MSSTTNGSTNPLAESKVAPPVAADQNASSNDLSKDQVGWYFVEQYYNTVSKSPEKLHLFYGKKSQFVYGVEAEVAKISVGRQVIQERIKQLDFQDCKVRITNVDTQSSYDNIVIQVIGEFSNKGGEPKKFVQTFILAQQPSGYFVLNDILRSIDDDDVDEDAAEPQEGQLEAQEASVVIPPIKAEQPEEEETTAAALDTVVVDKKLEEVSAVDTSTSASVVDAAFGTTQEAEPESAAKTEPTTEPSPDPDTAAREIEEEDVKEPEKPKDPSPTPIPAKTVTEAEKPAPTLAPAPVPAKPMTWASRVAAGTGAPRPVVPLKAPTPAVPTQARPAAAPQPIRAAHPAQPATSQPAEATPARKDDNEWQTAGDSSKRQNRPQPTASSADKDNSSCFVKYVSDKVQQEDLRAALSVHGNIKYLEVNRSKNCAFVDFSTPQSALAAISESPYTVNGENVSVEPRRRQGTFGGSGYGPNRGGMSGRSRGGFEGGRTSSQGRGGFGSQGGRGRGGSTRGARGGAQTTTST